MQLYRYDKVTKEYVGELPALPDPVASDKAGKIIFAIPPHCTVVKPEIEAGKKAVFNGKDWDIVFDYRGQTVYKKTNGTPMVITEYGDIPKGYTSEKPVLLQDLKIAKIQEVVEEMAKESSKKVEIGKVLASTDDLFKFNNMLSALKDKKFTIYSDGENKSIILRKEELEHIVKFLYIRGLLLPIKKDEIIKAVKRVKSKKELNALELNFDISDEIEKCLVMTDQGLEAYIESLMN